MALPNRNNPSSSSARPTLHPHVTAQQKEHNTASTGLPRAARPQPPRMPMHPATHAPKHVSSSVPEPEPEQEEPDTNDQDEMQAQLEFDDGTDVGAYDDNAYIDSNEASEYNQQPPMSSFAAQAAAMMQQQSNAIQQQAVSATPAVQVQEPDDVDDTPKKRNKYNRNNKSALKSSGAVSENSARTWRMVITGLLVVFVILGAKNALIPPKSMSSTEVQQIAMQTSGNTGFPLSQGAAIAQAFAQAYIPLSGDSASNAVLANFYAGQKFDPSGSSTVSVSTPSSTGSNMAQQIKAGPFVFSQHAIDDKTANFVIGMLIYQTTNGIPIVVSGTSNIDYKWLYLNIGVVYDKDKNTFAIDKNSPTVVAEPSMTASNDLKEPKEPGDGQTDDEVTKAAKDTVINFMKAWGQSDQSSLSTLVSKDKTSNTMNGLNGVYTLSDDSSGLQFEAYGKPAGDPYYRGLVTVQWVDKISADQMSSSMHNANQDTSNANIGDSSVTYTSKYILKLEKTSDGKYLVQDINPYYYVPKAD